MAAMKFQPAAHHGASGDNNDTSTPVEEEEPDSPTSPSSCAPPNGYPPFIIRGGYGLMTQPPLPLNQEAHCNGPTRAMDDAFLPIQDDGPLSSDDLECDCTYPAEYAAEPWMVVRQAMKFAEMALEYHNDDPSNKVKYELTKAAVSNYILEGSCDYCHVNFTARAKDDEDSEERLFFAELSLKGDFTSLTCFRSLTEEEEQVAGCTGMDSREGSGIDLEHCYACEDVLKHPRDGASYQAGHLMGRLYDGP